jgi:lysylphosphatidylglycerol synthetase-like protein (DUF2156 family)
MSIVLAAPRLAFDPAAVIDHPSGYLALSARNLVFRIPDSSGFIAYRKQGVHWIALGGVHAPAAERVSLLEAFMTRAERVRRHILAVQVRQDQVELFGTHGFTVNRFGTSYGVELTGFSLAGTRRMKARQKAKQARNAGFRVLEVGTELPRTDETYARLHAISAAWLKAKHKKELDFMIGEIGGPNDVDRRVFTVHAPARPASGVKGESDIGTIIGFITYVPVRGQRPGYLHDLTRRLPDAPVGVMELCNATAIERFQDEGVAHLHFGFTPFALDCGHESPFASPLLAKLAGLLWRHGQMIYPAQSQVAYKLKWGPTVIEPEYLACRPLSLRAIWDLLVLTRSL